jgi:hypothetical protein
MQVSALRASAKFHSLFYHTNGALRLKSRVSDNSMVEIISEPNLLSRIAAKESFFMPKF